MNIFKTTTSEKMIFSNILVLDVLVVFVFYSYPKILRTSSEVCCSENTSVAKIPFSSLSINICLGCGIKQW
jgi:hypothetical protein